MTRLVSLALIFARKGCTVPQISDKASHVSGGNIEGLVERKLLFFLSLFLFSLDSSEIDLGYCSVKWKITLKLVQV
jgi:hypothetical protein